ncbi:hypothetical protein [Rhizobium paknamense]|uniref:Uncharacterized protein n=1 Tax=Rhizobium paknamense TaxID=1206817 RepID=A0ABU0IB17_9HYPH|nr:hypothetical protein [Rhizobium paknamense]MDQ0455413.1 hypothetical protein [Rhizobium paknamense]
MAAPIKDQNSNERRAANDGVTTTEARQGFRGKPVLIVLLAGLILALVLWIPAEWWGHSIEPARDPATETTRPTTTPAQPEQPRPNP